MFLVATGLIEQVCWWQLAPVKLTIVNLPTFAYLIFLLHPQRGHGTYHCSLFVGQEDPDDGLLGGARVGSAGVSRGLQDSQGVGGRWKGLGPTPNPTTSHLDLQKGWHRRRRAGEVCTVAHGLQQLLLPLLQGVQFTGVLLIGLTETTRQRALTQQLPYPK